jgi:hypothetical protein
LRNEMLKRPLTVLFVLSLTLSVFLFAFQAVSASSSVSTNSFVEVSPDPHLVGQAFNITFDVQPPPPTTADQIVGVTLLIGVPDGTSVTIGPFAINPDTPWVCYTPSEVGVYTLVLQYSGQSLANGTIFYLPSKSAQINLIVNSPTPKPTPTSNAPAPVICSVSPISATCLQTIRIDGSGFGNTQPVTMSVGDGSIDTVGGGQGFPGVGGTPVIQIHDDNPASNPWQAGVQDGPTTGSCSIGIFLVSWSDTEIVLGGFGSALSPIIGQREWSILLGDAMRIVVITPGGIATYNTTVSGNGTQTAPAPSLPTPELDVSCQSSTTGSDFKVTVDGNLTCNGTSLASVPVLISYSVNGGTSWNDLTVVDTDAEGGFLALWKPLVTGDFLIRASYVGNATFQPTAATVNLIVTPTAGENVFSVTSNSTVSGFYFDSASNQLGFTVSGPSGTRGFVDLYVSKSVVSDVSNLKVSLDGSPLNFTSSSQEDSWCISFSYHHSIHNVNISLGSPEDKASIQNLSLVSGAGFTTAVAITVLVLVKRRRRTNS